MSIRMRILSSIVLSVFVAVACAAGIVYQQSRKDALEDFGGASRGQLRLVRARSEHSRFLSQEEEKRPLHLHFPCARET